MLLIKIALILNALAEETDTSANTQSETPEYSDEETNIDDNSSDAAESNNEPAPQKPTINPVTQDVVSTTQEIIGDLTIEQTVIPVWHFGPDIYLSANLAISYASAASKRERTDFVAVSPIELMKQDMTINGQGTIEGCTKTNMSTARLKKLSQELDMALAYYELDLATEKFDKAEAGLLCLNSILDTDVVSRLYFLQGLLEYTNGNEKATKEAYQNALRFTANFTWDDMFAPDSQPLFESAKAELTSAKGVPLKIYPESAKGLLWINGIPASDEQTPTLHIGDNMLQFEGVEMENAKIHVTSQATEITLVVPSALDKELIDWVNTPEHQEAVDVIAKSIYPMGHDLYALKDGLMYSTTLTDAPIQWVQNEIPKLTQVFGVNTKATIGRALFWTGSAMLASGGLYSANQASIALNAVEVAQTEGTSWDIFDQQEKVYQDASGKYQSGMLFTGTGALFTGIGYWLQQ